MNRVLITNLAKSDILNIKEYIVIKNPEAAQRFINSLIRIFEMLSEYPNAGVKKAGIKNPNVQVYTIKKKYNIVYKQKNNNIEILRVLNKYQNLFAIL